MLRTLTLIALVSCSKGSDPPAPTKTVPAASTPAKKKPMRAMRMHSTGFLEIKNGDDRREEQLPESPLKHGEYPEGCWVAPDGTLYAVGKQYTGVPGPDFGVVWKRTPKGEWSTAFRLKDLTFHSIAGRAATDIVVGGLRTYVTFDGTAWTPHDFGTSVNYVWTDGKRLLAQDQDDTELFELGKSAPKRVTLVKHDSFADKYGCAHDGFAYRVFEKDKEIGEADLSPEEEAEINGELKEIQEHPERIHTVK